MADSVDPVQVRVRMEEMLADNIAFQDAAERIRSELGDSAAPILQRLWKEKYGSDSKGPGIDQFVHGTPDKNFPGGAWLDFGSRTAGAERGYRDQDIGMFTTSSDSESAEEKEAATPRKDQNPHQMYDRQVPLQTEYEIDVGPTRYPRDKLHERQERPKRFQQSEGDDPLDRTVWKGLQEEGQTDPGSMDAVVAALGDTDEAEVEVAGKTYSQIQKETAEKWANRALACIKLSLDAASPQDKLTWALHASDHHHEALEHAALIDDKFETSRAIDDMIQPEVRKMMAGLGLVEREAHRMIMATKFEKGDLVRIVSPGLSHLVGKTVEVVSVDKPESSSQSFVTVKLPAGEEKTLRPTDLIKVSASQSRQDDSDSAVGRYQPPSGSSMGQSASARNPQPGEKLYMAFGNRVYEVKVVSADPSFVVVERQTGEQERFYRETWDKAVEQGFVSVTPRPYFFRNASVTRSDEEGKKRRRVVDPEKELPDIEDENAAPHFTKGGALRQGDHVQALDEDGHWRPATVLRETTVGDAEEHYPIPVSAGQRYFTVRFDDGSEHVVEQSREVKMSSEQAREDGIRSLKPPQTDWSSRGGDKLVLSDLDLKPGDEVEGLGPDGVRQGVVKSIEDGGVAVVRWEGEIRSVREDASFLTKISSAKGASLSEIFDQSEPQVEAPTLFAGLR